ncbi:MAG: cytochrome C peroxidase [Bacteroidetes bacterium]|nr:cytochrome C peroxidase [Bacteroidota bacterium]
MKKLISCSFLIGTIVLISFTGLRSSYNDKYNYDLENFKKSQELLLQKIGQSDLTSSDHIKKIRIEIEKSRLALKKIDFWLRYLEPTVYKKINGPLPVEWETEVFEKFEKPYKRIGAGLTIAELYLEEERLDKATLLGLIDSSLVSLATYEADSITKNLNTPDHFYLCNRLYLLNLAAIYTSGFECPNTDNVIKELLFMLRSTNEIYQVFNESFPNTSLSSEYLDLYAKTVLFVEKQSTSYDLFDHYTFIKDYVNPLYGLNQKMIKDYHIVSRSMIDFSLNKNATSIFSKSLYNGQNTKGVFIRVNDLKVLTEIEAIGKKLFYDPLLSGNNQRSCASCHSPTQFFADTLNTASLQFDHINLLPRNTPSLVNAEYNHLLMQDGKHITLTGQGLDVITNPMELNGNEKEIIEKILSCDEYKIAFKKFLKLTPQEKSINMNHITSALSIYYSKFSNYYSPFDEAMNNNKSIDESAKKGFNVFMSKAQCATCHFVPFFNGVKPPYIGSEFEVLGVPADKTYKRLSDDKGRYLINPAVETMNAFRTGTIRNIAMTKPYMHNGVFDSLMEVIDFYNAGGGAGRGLVVENQTLSSDSLLLTDIEKNQLITFMNSLTEKIPFESTPEKLPVSKIKSLNTRKVGGEY